jgi:hypothetical protein
MHKRLFPQRFLPDLRYFGELKWAINKCIVSKIKANALLTACNELKDWEALDSEG